MPKVTVLMDYTEKFDIDSEVGEDAELAFGLDVPRLPSRGEIMYFEGASESGLELSVGITEVTMSFYLAGEERESAVRTELSVTPVYLSDRPWFRDDLVAVLRLHGAVFP
jgi:hypothetical protein